MTNKLGILTGASFSSNPDQIPYPDEFLAEQCDVARSKGAAFVLSATFNPVNPLEPIAVQHDSFPKESDKNILLPPHDPLLVDELPDSSGILATSLTNAACWRSKDICYVKIDRLMRELPEQYLVYAADEYSKVLTANSQKKPKPVGIKLLAIPTVIDLVSNAYTRLPADETQYPPGALVLASEYRLRLLDLFRKVLTPATAKP